VALAWAAELRRRQQRKGKSVPYMAYLIAVSAVVWEDGGDEEQAIAALLHDAIEGTGVSAEQIAQRFGARVAQILVDCIDTTGTMHEGGEKEAWLLRKTRYLQHLQGAHPNSLLVNAAVKAHNARDMLSDHRLIPSSRAAVKPVVF
jgi:(p)ppGpp synthase/HD superfamily hydrolase